MRLAAYLIVIAVAGSIVASTPRVPSTPEAAAGIPATVVTADATGGPATPTAAVAAARPATSTAASTAPSDLPGPTANLRATPNPSADAATIVSEVRAHLVRTVGGEPSDWEVVLSRPYFDSVLQGFVTGIKYYNDATGTTGHFFRDEPGAFLDEDDLQRRIAAAQMLLPPLERKTDPSGHAFFRAHATDRVMLQFSIEVTLAARGDVERLIESLGGAVVVGPGDPTWFEIRIPSDRIRDLAAHEGVTQLHLYADTWATALRSREPATPADLGQGPGRPYTAEAILEAFRSPEPENAVDPVLEREVVAQQVADQLWTFDGRRYATLRVKGLCPNVDRCSLVLSGTPAAALHADTHRFTVTLRDLRVEVATAGHALAGIAPPLDSKIETLARALTGPFIERESSMDSVQWRPPPEFGTFVVRYSIGDLEDTSYRIVTLDVPSRRVVAFDRQEWAEWVADSEPEDPGPVPYEALPRPAGAPVHYTADSTSVVLRATTDDALETGEPWPPVFTLYGDGRAIHWRFRDHHSGQRPCPPARAIPAMRVARLTTDQVQALLRYALRDARLATVEQTYEPEVPTQTQSFDISADGDRRTLTIRDVEAWYEQHPPDPDAGRVLRLWRRLSDFGRDVASGAAADGGVYEPDRYQIRLVPVSEKPAFRPAPWPWPDIRLADFGDAEGFTPRFVTATARQALRVCDTPWDPKGPEGQIDGVVVRGPDGEDYRINIRPLLPDEEP